MKILFSIVFCLFFLAPAVFGQPAAIDPLEFLPPAARQADSPAWLTAYAEELLRLEAGAVTTKAALRSTATFCRTARLPADPLLAARLVSEAIAESDVRLRRGEPAGIIKVAVSSSWQESLQAGETSLRGGRNGQALDNKGKPELTRIDATPAPRDKAHANQKIADTVKEKKEKKDKKVK